MSRFSDAIEAEIDKENIRILEKTKALENDLPKLDGKVKLYTCLALIFVVLGFIVAIYGIIVYSNTNFGDTSIFNLNLIGDFYAGTISSLWSLAGLLFIYVAFLGQKQQLLQQQLEIMYSRIEVKFTRLELIGQKEEMKTQNTTLLKQRFENTFFHLINNHQEIISGIDIRMKNKSSDGYTISAQGRDCFKIFYKRFKKASKSSERIIDTNSTYLVFYEKNESDLSHYFRNLYHILKFVDAHEEIDKNEKFKYASFYRALISNNELILLFYNGLSKNGKTHLKPLMEKYSFLKNMNKNQLIDKRHLNEYNELVYASSVERKNLVQKGNDTEH